MLKRFYFRGLQVAMLALFLAQGLVAQDLKFFNITTKDGLSQSTINCITQDNEEYIWVGTEDGLNRYNGQNTTVFKRDPNDSTSISDNEIERLYIDDNGVLWIATINGGLNRFDKNTQGFTHFRHDENDPNSLSDDMVTDIIRKDESTIWVSTSHGLNTVDINTGEVTSITTESNESMFNDNIRCLLMDAQGLLWLGTANDGVVSYDHSTGYFNRYLSLNDSIIDTIAYSNRIRYLYEDSRGNLWIGKDGGGLTIFDRESHTEVIFLENGSDPTSLSNNRVTSIVEDELGQLWVGTENGLNIFNYETQNFKVFESDDLEPASISANYIRCLYEDAAKTMWVGTYTAGINTYHGISNKFNHFKKELHSEYSLSSNLVLAFGEDPRGILWVGTFESGLSAFDREKREVTHYPRSVNKTHSKILAIHVTGDSAVWFGTWGGGINYYNHVTGEFGKPLSVDNESGISDNDVTCFIEDDKGFFWLGTYGGGVNRYDPRTGEFTAYMKDDGLVSNFVFDLLFDSEGNLWVATKHGLNRFNLETNEIELFEKDDLGTGLSNNSVHVLHEDKSGNLWMGTKYGLNQINLESMDMNVIHEVDGLAGDIVYGILEDEEGYLWVSTTNGLSKFKASEFDEKGAMAFKNYSAMDGLQDNEFNQNAYYRSKTGELFFGGVNGYNHFYPKDITDNTHIPNIVLTSFKIYGREVPLDSAIGQKTFIELSYKDNFFSFEFAALDYIASEKNMYRYMMEGLDDNWSIPSTRPFANYTNLGGGDYVFRVQGTNNDGVWNEEGVAIHIRIIPPFYKTTWFFVMCAIVALLSFMLFVRVREAKIKQEKKILEEKVAQRTEELAQKNRDIVDSINYARTIQEAILPERQYIFDHLQDAFILYLPKDIVSGDFYWFAKKDNKKIIAAVDCTGHGVPGAFMSMIGNNLLNQIVIENGITDPGKILEALNKGVQRALKQGSETQDTNDGMDVALCVIDSDTDELHFAGAYRPLYYVSTKELDKTSGDKYPIGGAHVALDRPFFTKTKKLKKGDSFYIFSDGYPDQFGGPKGKKFMGKRFTQLILDICELPMQEQRAKFEEALSDWASDYEQVDDILVIGVRY